MTARRRTYTFTLDPMIMSEVRSIALNEGMILSRWIEEALVEKIKAEHPDQTPDGWHDRLQVRWRAGERLAARRKKSGLD